MSGTLEKLEELKRTWGPQFRAKAAKRRKITQLCADLHCKYFVRQLSTGRGGRLAIGNEWCSKRDCPRGV